MFCKSCGSKNFAGAKFCAACGMKITTTSQGIASAFPIKRIIVTGLVTVVAIFVTIHMANITETAKWDLTFTKRTSNNYRDDIVDRVNVSAQYRNELDVAWRRASESNPSDLDLIDNLQNIVTSRVIRIEELNEQLARESLDYQRRIDMNVEQTNHLIEQINKLR
jgi:hypothetical protein